MLLLYPFVWLHQQIGTIVSQLYSIVGTFCPNVIVGAGLFPMSPVEVSKTGHI